MFALDAFPLPTTSTMSFFAQAALHPSHCISSGHPHFPLHHYPIREMRGPPSVRHALQVFASQSM